MLDYCADGIEIRVKFLLPMAVNTLSVYYYYYYYNHHHHHYYHHHSYGKKHVSIVDIVIRLRAGRSGVLLLARAREFFFFDIQMTVHRDIFL
jgi:hypothetical protein